RRRAWTQLGSVRCRDRGADVSRCDRVFHDGIETDVFIRREQLLREELIAQALGNALRYAGELSVTLESSRVGIHPIDGLAIGLHEASKDILALLQRILIGNEHADRITADRGNVACSRDHPDLAFLDGIDPEWRLRPADIDVT